MKVSPVARTESLIVKEVDGETLVYDLKTNKAHCLNATAGRVWKKCDGLNSVSQITEILSREANSTVDEDLVWLALDQLQRFKLLEEAPAKPVHLFGMTRRQMVARLGIAAVALPAIVAIVSPTAKAQASLLPPQTCCVNPSDCISNSCIHTPTPCILYPPNPQNSTKGCA